MTTPFIRRDMLPLANELGVALTIKVGKAE
jgi:hypothetical protein